MAHSMLDTVKRTIAGHGLLSRGQHVLAAVSGGADSVAMLHVLKKLAGGMRLSVSVAHLDHMIRGRQAEQDAAFVKRLARQLKVPCVVGRRDVPHLAEEMGISVEMAARQARYGFLVEAGARTGADCIATAHTSDDQAETILLRLLRGSGLTGLGGIRYEVNIGGVRVVRPMLDVDKAQAVAFLRGMGAAWREDSSNKDLEYQRNRVRHEVLPVLESRLNPGVRRALLRTGRILRDEDEWLGSLAAGIMAECLVPGRSDAISAEALSRHPVGARRRVLRMWLASAGVPPELLDFDAVERVDRLLSAKRGGVRAGLAGGWFVARRCGQLSVSVGKDQDASPFRVRVRIPGETILAGGPLKITTSIGPGIVRERQPGPGSLPARASLSLDALRRRALYVRSWRPGDRIEPFGLCGSRKIQDVFVDAKTPRGNRLQVPIFECAGRIVWLPGYRIARGWEVAGADSQALQILVQAVR